MMDPSVARTARIVGQLHRLVQRAELEDEVLETLRSRAEITEHLARTRL